MLFSALVTEHTALVQLDNNRFATEISRMTGRDSLISHDVIGRGYEYHTSCLSNASKVYMPLSKFVKSLSQRIHYREINPPDAQDRHPLSCLCPRGDRRGIDHDTPLGQWRQYGGPTPHERSNSTS